MKVIKKATKKNIITMCGSNQFAHHRSTLNTIDDLKKTDHDKKVKAG